MSAWGQKWILILGGSMYWIEVKHICLGDLFTCEDDFTSARACGILINRILFLFQISKNFSNCKASQMCTHGLGVKGMKHTVMRSDSFCPGCHSYRYTQLVIGAYTVVWAALVMRYCYLLFAIWRGTMSVPYQYYTWRLYHMHVLFLQVKVIDRLPEIW